MKRNLIYLRVITVAILLLIVLSFFGQKEQGILYAVNLKMQAVITPLAALFGLLVTVSINIVAQNNVQRQEMLQQPLVFIRCLDYEDKISVMLQNKGLGPLIITDYKLEEIDNPEKKYTSMYECLEELEGKYDNYTGNQNGLVLSANEERNLLELTATNPDFLNLKAKLRDRLSQLKFVVAYTDIYNNEMRVYTRELDWYGRDIEKIKN